MQLCFIWIIISNIKHIYTDVNSWYSKAFEDIPEPSTTMKLQAHFNYGDNFARLNKKNKKYTKPLKMLEITLGLFLKQTLISIRLQNCYNSGTIIAFHLTNFYSQHRIYTT